MIFIELFSLILLIAMILYFVRFGAHLKAAKQRGVASLMPSRLNPVMFALGTVFLIIGLVGFEIKSMRFSMSSRTSVAKSNLVEISFAQMQYHNQYQSYAGGKDAFKDLEFKTYGPAYYYSYFLDQDVFLEKSGDDPKFSPDKEWPFSAKPSSGENAFLAFAVGEIDSDPCPDVWTINEEKELVHLVNDINDSYKPGQCLNCPWAKEQTGFQLFLEKPPPIIGSLAGILIVISPILLVVSIIRIKKDKKKMLTLKEMETGSEED